MILCNHDGVRASIEQYINLKHRCSSDIATLLIGSKSVRHGNTSVAHAHLIRERVNAFLDNDEQIQILTMWGGAKGYGQDHDRLGVDLGDVLGILRFAKLAEQLNISGSCCTLHTTICCEDIGEQLLNKDKNRLLEKIDFYVTGLSRLARILSNGSVSVVRESEIISPTKLTHLAHENAALFETFWWDSAMLPYEARDGVQSFEPLKDRGWVGAIKDETRRFYIARVRNENPGSSEVESVRDVCMYLGLALARRMLRFDSYAGGVTPIRASLLPAPPGAYDGKITCRLEYKVKNSKNSNCTVAPWLGFGISRPKDNGWDISMVGMREYQKLNLIENSLMIGNQTEQQLVRADFLEI